ncbi:TetR/AcrR family transcriptional regulator [Culicoidibacter larvae]|uniref:TetR/AcrR family transcriptional regulator n=1 Tax=Culicoidibacter larvae TaxID=2579976 RepID=A0A5R8QDW9_9FIRM|nr:TetR/AcrR family transcriptional regulator [Culicoidibacter larvae]TLG75431.1 TetR/AcrR family transcriptional regulator [Culicoidibacter larvae]
MQDKKADVTREALHSSFYELLKEKRYEDINVKDITENAFTSRANFYYYYRSKEEMMYALFYELKYSIGIEIDKRVEQLREVDVNDSEALSAILYPSIFRTLEYVKSNKWIFILDKRTNDFDFISTLRVEYEKNITKHFSADIKKYNNAEFIRINTLFYTSGVAAVIAEWISTDMQTSIKLIATTLYLQLYNLFMILYRTHIVD